MKWRQPQAIMKDEKKAKKLPHFIIHHSSFIIHPFLNVPRRGLGEAVDLRFRVFLAVLGVLHHVGESHQRLVGGSHQRLQRRPLVLELLLLRQFLAFGDFIKLRVQLRQLGGAQAQSLNGSRLASRSASRS